MNKFTLSALALTLTTLLVGCSTSGEQYSANVYKAGQVNSRQAAKTVKILAVMPAKIEVDNTEGKQNAQMIGGILGAVAGGVIGNKTSNHSTTGTVVGVAGGAGVGAAAGSLVKDTVLVDGVSLTYVEDGQTYNSAQVGKMCEFSPGVALVISTDGEETRLQPNATCPAKS